MHPMRRKDRALSQEIALQLLEQGEYGILATVDKNGQAHATPMSYVYALEDDGHCLYMHAAEEGQKIDNLLFEPRAAFTVVGQTSLLPEKFSTLYQSVMAFGKVSFVEEASREHGLFLLAQKYSPNYLKEAKEYIANAKSKTLVLRLAIEHLSAKGRTQS